LITSNLLVHYNPTLPLRLAANALQYGLGAVISHILPSGEKKPIARALTKSEKNYSQIGKEALALDYMYLWSPKIPHLFIRSRLHAFVNKYNIEFRSTDAHSNADALFGDKSSRLETTQRDPILCKVKNYTQKGRPEQIPENLKIYHSKMAELIVEEGCLLWGGRVIIPPLLEGESHG
jgi:hypothetical protein